MQKKLTLDDMFQVRQGFENGEYSKGEIQAFLNILDGEYRKESPEEAKRIAQEDADIIDGKITL